MVGGRMRISLSESGWVLYRGNRGRPKRVNQSRRSPKTRSLTGTPHRLIVRLNEMKQGKEVDVKVMGRDVKITLDSWPFSEWKPLKGASGLTGGCRATPPQCHRLTLHACTEYMCILMYTPCILLIQVYLMYNIYIYHYYLIVSTVFIRDSRALPRSITWPTW